MWSLQERVFAGVAQAGRMGVIGEGEPGHSLLTGATGNHFFCC